MDDTTQEAHDVNTQVARRGLAARLKDRRQRSHTEHELACDQAIDRIANKQWKGLTLKLYSIVKGVVVGGVFGHLVLALEAVSVVPAAVGALFGGFVAGKVAVLNIAMGWGASAPAKRYSFSGFKEKKVRKIDKGLAGIKKIDGLFDKVETKLSIPSLDLYEAQGRVLTRMQRVGLTCACVGRAAAATAAIFAGYHYGYHYLVAQSAGSIVHPTLPLGESASAQHHATALSHATVSHSGLARVKAYVVKADTKLAVLPDKIFGLAGMMSVSTPMKVSSSYRRRRIVCKRYFDGHKRWYLPLGEVHRKEYKRPLGFIPRPLLEHAIREEKEYREQRQAAGLPVVVSPKQLTAEMRQQAKAQAYGHSVGA